MRIREINEPILLVKKQFFCLFENKTIHLSRFQASNYFFFKYTIATKKHKNYIKLYINKIHITVIVLEELGYIYPESTILTLMILV